MIIIVLFILFIQCCLYTRNLLKAFMCIMPFNAWCNPEKYALSSSPVGQSEKHGSLTLRPLLHPIFSNISVHACGPKETVLFSEKYKHDIYYVLYFDMKQILYTALSTNNSVYEDYLLQGIKINLFFNYFLMKCTNYLWNSDIWL